MSRTHSCPECGTPLPADTPGGLCPRCLMGAALAATQTVRPGPASDPAPEGRHVDDPGFRRAVLELGLVDATELEWLAAGTAGDLSRLARALIRAGKLTAYQAAALAQGKARGLVIGDYLVLDKLGRGGMGVVFKARHRKDGRVVALKILPPSFAHNADAVKRFRREFEVAARLSHPNVVAAIDAAEDRGVHFLTMEYIEGHDLDELVDDVGPLPLKLALHATIQAVRGLEAAHARGIVHRDIKPANLILDGSGQVKVLDLGLARVIESSNPFAETATALTQSGAYMGTVDFIAPEQADDSKRADHRADVYSLGCTLYFLLTGHPPFEDETVLKRLMAHQNRPAPSLRARRPEIPAALESIYQAMMAKRPGDRPQAMTEVIAALEACRSSPGDAAEARATLKDFAGRALKRAAPRPRTRGTKASIFAQRRESDGMTFDPDLRLEDLVMDYREVEHVDPLTEAQLPPKLPRIAAPAWQGRRRRASSGVIAGVIGMLGLGGVGYWLVNRTPSKPAKSVAVSPKAVANKDAAAVEKPGSDEAGVHYTRGVGLFTQKKYDQAAVEFRESARLVPTNAATHFYLGRSFHNEKKYDEALVAYGDALRLQPVYPQVYIRLARMADVRGKPDEAKAAVGRAVAAFREAIRLKPAEAADLHTELGMFFQERNDINAAIVEYREAVRLKPDEFRPRDQLGALLGQQGKAAEGLAELHELVRRHPENTEGRRDLAFLLKDQGRLDEAEAVMREAVRREPDVAVNLYYYGVVLDAAGRREAAIAPHREAYRIDTKDGTVGLAVFALVEDLRQVGRTAEATQILRELVKSRPDSARAWKEWGNDLTRRRQWAAALPVVTKAAELSPSDDMLSLQAAALAASLGEDATYRRLCQMMLDRYADKKDGYGAAHAGWACLLSPNPVALEQATRLTEAYYLRAVAKNPKAAHQDYDQLRMALAEYRQGHYAQGAALARKIRRTAGIAPG